jgi:hypothetical protein
MLFVISVAAYYSIARWPPPAAPLTGAIEIARPPSPSGSPTPATARVEAPTTGSGELSAADATTGDLLHLDVRSQGLCWLSATVDGTRVVYRLMQAGERQTIEMHDEAVLRVGDPAAFAFSIDGRAGRPLGRAGKAATVHITRQNYREFLDQ